MEPAATVVEDAARESVVAGAPQGSPEPFSQTDFFNKSASSSDSSDTASPASHDMEDVVRFDSARRMRDRLSEALGALGTAVTLMSQVCDRLNKEY